jgi:hypothetical protein
MVRGKASLIIIPLLGIESQQFNIPKRRLPLLKDALVVFNHNAKQFRQHLDPTSQLDRVAQLGTPPKVLPSTNKPIAGKDSLIFNKRISGSLNRAAKKRKPASSTRINPPIIKPNSSKAISICGAIRVLETSINRHALGLWQPTNQPTANE